MANNGIVLEAENVRKIYKPGMEAEVRAVDGVDLKIKSGEIVCIMGPSGSGKTTLLDMIGCLLKPSSGKILIDGTDTSELSDRRITRIRGDKIGFVFQQYNLIPTFTALENVALSMRIMGMSKGSAREKARKILETVGLGERLSHRPSQLSGGEQQRVAIARALANDPEIILGDEPTGNLDTKTSVKILELLKNLNHKGYTIVVVTHDPRIKEYADRVIELQDGKIIRETRK